LNGTHELIICANDGNLLREILSTVENTEAVIDTSRRLV